MKITSPDGSFHIFIPNGNGQSGALGIDGITGKIKVRTAGDGFRVVSADGRTLLDVDENGSTTPGLLAERTNDPTAGEPRQIYVLDGKLKYFDGANSMEVVQS